MKEKIKNDLDIVGDIQTYGNLNLGNNIEKQEINLTINQAPSEQQLRDAIRAEIEFTLQQQQILAEDKAREKLSNFSEKVLPKLVKAEMIGAFSDPTIQMFYRTVQQTAICSEREIDYDVLSELLVYRINNKENIAKKASITKAAEIVDKISDDALLAITIRYCSSFSPIFGNIKVGLNALENLFKNIINDRELPPNNDWIDNAEILGIVRIESLTTMLRFEDIYFKNLTGYVSKGIEKNSIEYNEVINKLKYSKLPLNLLVDHELNPNYVRLDIANESSIETIQTIEFQFSINGPKSNIKNISEEQKKVVREIFDLYKNNRSFEDKIKENFIQKIDEYPYLNKVRKWWNSNLSPAMNINSIGRVLAHTNAKRLYESIPDMV